ncbi:MAG: type VI secretion system tip protein VgrG, partial [Leptolyngbya sp. SIO4C5]|nr:type VI secretion system tip protein VgrG [Leptolyngbya sp. SIO4C5]
ETQMDPHYNLLAIDILQEVNRIPTAQLVLLSGGDQQPFEISDTDFFKPGQKIRIQLRYEEEADETVFSGLVVKHGIQINRQKTILTLYLKDAAVKLTRQRRSAIFREKDDIAIIKDILSAAVSQDQQKNIQDLSLGTFTPTKTAIAHGEMVQFYCTDWDFILARAEANGLWVLVSEGEISVQQPQSLGGQPVTLVYDPGLIYDLEIEADIRDQFEATEAIAWASPSQALTEAQTADEYALELSNLDPAALGPLVGAGQRQLVSGAELVPAEAKAWASAHALQSRLSMLRGRIRLAGQAGLRVGDALQLENFGDRFNGTTLITGVRHRVNEAGWQTDIQFGLSAAPLATRDDVMAAPASGLLPAVQGLQIGIVQQADLKDELRVQVQIPRLTPTPDLPAEKNDGLLWARLATLEAGLAADGKPGRGTVFRPEKGDEVILGFLNDDPRQAVILGALYSDKNKPPVPVAAQNNQRGIFTKEKLKLAFSDQDKSIRLETPNTNRIILIDEDGAIYIVDENNNQLTMNADGIQISSDQDITISAKGNMTLQGKQVDVN